MENVSINIIERQSNITISVIEQPQEVTVIATGTRGDTGPAGTSGCGVVLGGLTGEVLSKKSNSDNDTEWININTSISNGLSTGILTGGLITPTSGCNVKFDISAGSGWIIDNYTDPLNPTKQLIQWDNIVGIPDNYLELSITYIALNSSGSVVQSNNIFSQAELRDYIFLGITGHPTGVVLYGVNYPSLGFDTGKTLEDFINAFGNFVISGNEFSPNGSNLFINKSLGETFAYGTNYSLSKKSPNVVNDPTLTKVKFFYSYRSAPNTWVNTSLTNTIDPNYYDGGSGLVPVSTGSFTIQQIYYFTGAYSNVTSILYGQKEYATISEAESNIQTLIDLNPAIETGIFRGWIIVKQETVNLSITTNAKFISSGKFGSTSSGGVSNITDHALLSNLSYDQSGHIGFVPDTLTIEGKALNANINVVAGLNKEIQFNDGGILGSSADFKYDKDAKAVNIGQAQLLPNNPLGISGDIDTYLQANIQNVNADGIYGSSDYIATANVGNDTSYYIDLGINNSKFADPEFPYAGPLDGYLASIGGNLSIVSGSAGKVINLFANGKETTDKKAVVDANGINITAGNSIRVDGFNVLNLIAEANSEAEETAFFAAGSKIVIRNDLL